MDKLNPQCFEKKSTQVLWCLLQICATSFRVKDVHNEYIKIYGCPCGAHLRNILTDYYELGFITSEQCQNDGRFNVHKIKNRKIIEDYLNNKFYKYNI